MWTNPEAKIARIGSNPFKKRIEACINEISTETVGLKGNEKGLTGAAATVAVRQIRGGCPARPVAGGG